MFLPTCFGPAFLAGSFCRHFGRHFRPQGPHGARGNFCERFPLLKGEGVCRQTLLKGTPKGELTFLGLALRSAVGDILGLLGVGGLALFKI